MIHIIKQGVADESLAPKFFLTLNADEALCKERLMALPEDDQRGGAPRFQVLFSQV